MSIFRKRKKDTAHTHGEGTDPGTAHPKKELEDDETKSTGLKMTEKILPILGPAQVGDPTSPVRPPSEHEEARGQKLEQDFVRKVGNDGTAYAVEHESEQNDKTD